MVQDERVGDECLRPLQHGGFERRVPCMTRISGFCSICISQGGSRCRRTACRIGGIAVELPRHAQDPEGRMVDVAVDADFLQVQIAVGFEVEVKAWVGFGMGLFRLAVIGGLTPYAAKKGLTRFLFVLQTPINKGTPHAYRTQADSPRHSPTSTPPMNSPRCARKSRSCRPRRRIARPAAGRRRRPQGRPVHRRDHPRHPRDAGPQGHRRGFRRSSRSPLPEEDQLQDREAGGELKWPNTEAIAIIRTRGGAELFLKPSQRSC